MTQVMVGVIAVVSFAVFAQIPGTPKFEVASIKLLNRPMDPHVVGLSVAHGTAKLEGATARQIIVQAYDVQRVRVLGGPSWYDFDQYNVLAKAENSDATQEQIRQMLQTLLMERFKLAVHRETRELTRYSLVVGKNGSKLREAQANEVSNVLPDQPRHLIFRNQPLITLVNTIANRMDMPVDDMTGLTGSYDFELDYTPDPIRLSNTAGTNGSVRLDQQEIVGDAVERLGLKLEARKAHVEVLIIDHIERPDEN